MTSYVSEQEKLIVEFAINTANLDAFPHHAMALELLKEQLLKTSNLASLQSQKISARVDKKIKDSHRLVPPAIKSFLEPMYSHCAAQGGNAHSFSILFHIANKFEVLVISHRTKPTIRHTCGSMGLKCIRKSPMSSEERSMSC